MKRPDKKSIWGIWSSTSEFRKRNLSNYIIVSVFGLFGIIVSIFNKEMDSGTVQSVLNVLLSLNGAILGLLIAGYSFSNALPKDVMAFAASSKAEDYPWSNFKQILLNYLYCYSMLFSGILLYCFIYLLSYLKLDVSFLSKNALENYYSFLFAITWLIQGFILSELKIFLFWIYENSLLLGQATAVSENMEPFDDGNA